MSHITGLGRACVLFAMMGGMQGVYAQGLAADAASAVQQASAPVAAIPALDPQVQSVQPQAGETTGKHGRRAAAADAGACIDGNAHEL
jgi:hypothetical protein